MVLKTIDYKGCKYAVQSYLKNDFANICELNGDSFHIDFINSTIETSGKETKEWSEKKAEFIISEIKEALDNLLDNL